MSERKNLNAFTMALQGRLSFSGNSARKYMWDEEARARREWFSTGGTTEGFAKSQIRKDLSKWSDEFARRIARRERIINLDYLRIGAAMQSVEDPYKTYTQAENGDGFNPYYYQKPYNNAVSALSPREQRVERALFEINKAEIIAAREKGIRDDDRIPFTLRFKIPGYPRQLPKIVR